MGLLYEDGLGVEQSYEKALECFQRAADQGDMWNEIALYNIGRMYEEGKGVEQSYEKALEYYQKAADQGLEEAKNKLEKVKEKLK